MATSTHAGENFADELNAMWGGWNQAMGVTFVRANGDEVIAKVVIGEVHLQPYGIVHGGVHTGVIEATCSAGAALWARSIDRSVVGVENATSFLKAARNGVLHVTARPIARGRRSQVWEATVADERGEPLAHDKVRLLCLEPQAQLAGERVRVGG